MGESALEGRVQNRNEYQFIVYLQLLKRERSERTLLGILHRTDSKRMRISWGYLVRYWLSKRGCVLRDYP